MADGDVSTGTVDQPHEYLSIDCTSSSLAPDDARSGREGDAARGGQETRRRGWTCSSRCVATRSLRLTSRPLPSPRQGSELEGERSGASAKDAADRRVVSHRLHGGRGIARRVDYRSNRRTRASAGEIITLTRICSSPLLLPGTTSPGWRRISPPSRSSPGGGASGARNSRSSLIAGQREERVLSLSLSLSLSLCRRFCRRRQLRRLNYRETRASRRFLSPLSPSSILKESGQSLPPRPRTVFLSARPHLVTSTWRIHPSSRRVCHAPRRVAGCGVFRTD